MTPVILDAWVVDLEQQRGRSPTTVAKYRNAADRLNEWLATQEVEWLHLDPEHLRIYTGAVLHAAGLAPRSRRLHVSAIKSVCRYLHERGHLRLDPSSSLTAPYAGRPLPTVMSVDSLGKLLMTCDLSTFKGLRDAALIGLMADTGARVSTLMRMNESDLQWSVAPDGRELLTLRLLGKGKVEHLAPVGDEGRLMVRAYMGHPDWRTAATVTASSDRVMWLNLRKPHKRVAESSAEDRRFSRTGVWKMIQRRGIDAGLPAKECHPHALRHMVGTATYEATGDIKAVAEQLGHRNVNTAEIYIHLALERKRAVSEAVGLLSRLDTPWSQLSRAEAQTRAHACKSATQ